MKDRRRDRSKGKTRNKT